MSIIGRSEIERADRNGWKHSEHVFLSNLGMTIRGQLALIVPSPAKLLFVLLQSGKNPLARNAPSIG
jgi:hypothetical protein